MSTLDARIGPEAYEQVTVIHEPTGLRVTVTPGTISVKVEATMPDDAAVVMAIDASDDHPRYLIGSWTAEQIDALRAWIGQV